MPSRTSSVASLPPALSRAVEVLAAPAGAGEALALLLAGVHDSPWPEVAWRFSRLTGDGFPAELAFTSADPASFRYTVEVAGPEIAEEDRLARAEALLECLGSPPLPEPLGARLRRMQKGGAPLRWGAWIGGRHSAGGSRLKLYLETPEDAPAVRAFLEERLGPDPLLPRQGLIYKGVGVEPATGRLEVYLGIPRLEVWEVERLLGKTGLAGRGEDLFALLGRALGRPFRETVPGLFGVSLTFGLEDPSPTFALFAACPALFGGDGAARIRLLGLAAELDWNLDGYAKLTEPLAGRTGPQTAHGVAAFAVAARGPATLGFSVRPPERPPELQELRLT